MNLILCGLAAFCLVGILLSRRFAWAVEVSMAGGAVLVLAMLAAGVSVETMLLAELALCAAALLCGRDAG